MGKLRSCRMGHHLTPFLRLRPFVAAIGVLLLPPAAQSQSLAEAVDTTNLVWTTGGDAPWFVQTNYTHDGFDAARSGNLTSNQISWIETSVIGPATLNYWVGTISGDSTVQASLMINGQFTPLELLAWPQNSAPYWGESLYDLGSGTNVMRWTVSASSHTTNAGFRLLDEVEVLPPRPLTIVAEPSDQTVYSGDFAFFYTAAIGTPPLFYQWQKNGANVPAATNWWLNFTVTTNDSGSYSLIVSNSQGFVSSSNAALTVLPPTPPFFTSEPGSITAYVGQSINLSGSVDGSPLFAFQWRKDDTNFTEMTAASSWGSTWLELTNISMGDAGTYSLFVTNDFGSVESSNAVLTVIPSVGPAITKHPRSLEVAEGVNTWMSIAASGDPEPAFTWTRVGEAPPPPPPGPPSPPIVTQPSQPKRSFNNVASTNAGVYFATAKNYGGEVSSREALLTVLPPITNLISWWQGAQDVFVTNGLAFLAQDTFGLAILSVSNPAAPVMLGGYNTPGHASGVCVDADWVYVVDGQSGLQIFSVTNPFNPILVGNYNTPYYLADLVVRSNLAYLADGKTGLLIVSINNPAAPTLVGSFKSNFSADYIRVAGDYAFVSSRYSEALPGTNVAGFFVINIADPAHPFEVGRLARGIGRFEIRDQIAFGVTGNSLEVIALTNPAQPVVIGTFQTYDYPAATNWPPRPPSAISASDVHVANDIAFVGGYSGDESRLLAVDVRNPTEPIPVGYYTNVGQRYALSAENNVIYFAGIGSPLDIIQTPFATGPAVPLRLTLSPPPGMQLGIQGRRGFHYDIESALAPVGSPWQMLHPLFLTNETATLPIGLSSSNTFFRLRQLD
jgi:hypothetical protein